MSARDLLIVAGESSGDLHAARLLTALRERMPGIRAFGLGGDELREAGFDAVADASEIAVVGIAEVLKILPRARQIFDQLLEEVDARAVRAAVLVDSPEFNLRMARQLGRRGVRVLYYVSPQVWAWRKGRIRQISRHVDTMLVLFPFEVDFYREHGVEVVHAGHPLVDEVPELESAWDADPPEEPSAGDETAGEKSAGKGGEIRLALLPGSRSSEVRALLPRMLGAVKEMSERRVIRPRLVQAPGVPAELFDGLVEAARLETPVERVHPRDRFQVLADSHLALCASGTATVEVGLVGTPFLMIYRLKWSTYLLGKLMVDLPHFCMVNLVLGERVVPEMIQRDAEPVPVAREALALLADRGRIDAMRRRLADLRPALGSSGASERAAEAVAARLEDLEDAA